MKKAILLSILTFCFAIAFSQNKNSTKSYKSGTKALESKKYSEAISLLTQSINDNPTPNAYYNRAVAYYYIGDSCSFCRDLRNAANLNDSDANNLYYSKCTFSKIDNNIPDSLKNKYPKISHLEIVYDKCSFDSLMYTIVNNGSEYKNSYSDQPIGNQYTKADTTLPVYTIVEAMPEFEGGKDARMKFLIENIKFPSEARASGTQGTVFISFIVETDGSITNISILKSPAKSLSDEAIRIVKLMPNWRPGKQNSKCVRVRFSMPIKFVIS